MIKGELGAQPEGIYRAFEEKPFASGLLYQQHVALLDDGQPVAVKLVHPETEALLQYDLELLPLLRGVFVQEPWANSKIENAIDDFSQTLRRKIDFVEQLRCAETVALDTEVFGILRVPLVYQQFSSSRTLTVERLPGKSLQEIVSLFQGGGGNGKDATSSIEYADLAHRLCVAWLRQALIGRHFPEEPSPRNITILPNGQIAFTDGSLASLSASEKANLWNYVIAVTTENPDRACFCLIREMEKGKEAVSESELRQRFRQIVPFRDYDGMSNSVDNNLTACLLAQWRLACKHGYQALPGASSFFRSLVTVTTVAQQLSAERDTLHRALQDVRLLSGVERCREILGAQQLGEQMDRYLAMMMDLPQNLDSLLTLVSEGRATQAPNTVRRQSDSGSMAFWVLVLAMVGIVLISHRLATINDSWSSEIRALSVILLGVILLRASTRSR